MLNQPVRTAAAKIRLKSIFLEKVCVVGFPAHCFMIIAHVSGVTIVVKLAAKQWQNKKKQSHEARHQENQLQKKGRNRPLVVFFSLVQQKHDDA